MRRLISLLGDLLFHASHSRLERELINRPQLDDRAFYDEFGFKIPDEDMKTMDGTFDAVVRYVALQRQTPA